MKKNSEPRPRILILGASGLLGSRISKKLSSSFEVYQHLHSMKADSTKNQYNINLQDFVGTYNTLKSLNPKVVINCAAMTDIEKCERLPEATWLINTLIAMNLAKVCSQLQIKFIQISTDHIVSKTHIRNEYANYYGINQYGCSKLQADNFITQNNDNSIVVRSNFFGTSPVSKNSFLDWIVNSLEYSKQITGFNDVFFNPVSIGFLIDILQFLIEIDFKGIINLGCEIPISKYDFICEIASKLDIEPRVISASRSTSSRQNIRYPDLALDISFLKSIFHRKIPLLTEMMDNEVEYRQLNPKPKESNAFFGQ